jgi:hypothetical protein
MARVLRSPQSFYIEAETYKVLYGMRLVEPFGDPHERSMKAKSGEFLRKGSRFEHIYYFGNPTELK